MSRDVLTSSDIIDLKVKAGFGDGPVTIDRAVFDALIDQYCPTDNFRPQYSQKVQNEFAPREAS